MVGRFNMKIVLTNKQARGYLERLFSKKLVSDRGPTPSLEVVILEEVQGSESKPESVPYNHRTQLLLDLITLNNSLFMFLLDKGFLLSFVTNVERYSVYTGRGNQFLDIPSAFTWDSTPEGHHFWHSLDKEFRSLGSYTESFNES